jgi:NAD(P)-dependent dehydrogenase (short-subunit alcohol dehydrogenase family)
MGIRCNAVRPHVVDTPLARVDRPNWEELQPRLTTQHSMRRIGTPEDAAAAITYLASPHASWSPERCSTSTAGFCAS